MPDAAQPAPEAHAPAAVPWWQGASIYQIYPRSFLDSNGDGIGDLPGITARLDHVASLNVDAIWLSPFFTSPMRDFGYDVADYRGVDPIFGTLADFDALIARAHQLGLKIIIDQVWSHTSDQHAWFQESRQNRSNPRADWYVWADPKPDGTPPSNWQSVFGGPAWTWDARRQQYYLHNFLNSQPDLNMHNPAVQDAILDVARFWLDRGVDGFRIDAINFAMHDPLLRDNPPASGNHKRTRPFDFQRRIHNMSHPDIPGFLERVAGVIAAYPDRFTVAEVGGDEAIAEMHAFTAGTRRLNSAYGFNFLYGEQLTPRLVADALAEWPETPGTGWPSWAFSNHDAPRAASRWHGPCAHDDYARLIMLLLVALRGNIFLYYGEELGLTQAEIGFADLQDPEAIANWPLTLGRDGARTPMPWLAGQPNAGFSMARPWLPLGADHAARAVDLQQGDPQSMLHWTAALMALRQQQPALKRGSARVVVANGDLLILHRTLGDATLVCAYNLGAEPIAVDLAIGAPFASHGGATDRRLPPYSGLIAPCA
ncbi:alpha-glucosidase [Sandarakinorhabdus cyanobacteriorum]|uniref:Alpha-glucosidase n=1 Tax=Sandarakinorhabdus cyanobacteriorum TaxID=1981098 RepID=A0A255YJ27_9SPHN|nr:alpha-amylase family glycosyl hydrolase [Sandarakinorhabdus cyanobacteriorum]OYQ29272.1 alpha-glucosidase [Sandarakinorhabdus cyanobacteriorum]